MTHRLFTREEVDALLPEVSELIETAMARHRHALALRRQLREEQERIQVSGGGLIDPRRWAARTEQLEALGAEVRDVLQEILGLGGVTKDLEMGLVDFPGTVGGEIVNLCWRHGETAVGFWHGLDEGYAQRRPLP